MASRYGQKVKILHIIDILRKYSDEQNPINAQDICRELEKRGVTAERKAIYDDIAELCDYGYDIIKTATPKKGYFLASREFEIPEIYLLSDAVRTAKFISAKKSRELISKLDEVLSINQVKQREKGIFFETDSKCANEEIYYNIDGISSAIEQKKKITFDYCTRSLSENRELKTNVKQMKLSPYALTWQGDYYYVIGNYEKYHNLLHLRLDRIKNVEISEEPYRHFSEVSEYKESFDIADYTKKLFGMYSGELEEIELKCNKKIIEQVIDRFSDKIFIKKVTEDTFSFSVEAAISEALVTWIMNYGDDIYVTSPAHLRERILSRAQEIIKQYK